MITLTGVKKSFAHIKFFIVPLLIVIILVSIIIVRFTLKDNVKTPEPPSEMITFDIQTSKGLPRQTPETTIISEATTPNIPDKMPILIMPQTSPIPEEEAAKLAGNLGFGGKPQLISAPEDETIYLWKNQEASFLIKSKSKKLQYEKLAKSSQQQNLTLNINQAVDALQKFIVKLGLTPTSLDLAHPKSSLLEDLSARPKQIPPDRAKFINLSYYQNIDGLPLISTSPGEYSLESLIGISGEILTLKVDLTINQEPQKTQDYPTQSFEDLSNELKIGNGVYISSVGNYGRTPQDTPLDIKVLKIKNIQLGYLKTQSSQELLPIMAFDAEVALSNNKIESVLIVLPVLKNVQINSTQNFNSP